LEISPRVLITQLHLHFSPILLRKVLDSSGEWGTIAHSEDMFSLRFHVRRWYIRAPSIHLVLTQQLSHSDTPSKSLEILMPCLILLAWKFVYLTNVHSNLSMNIPVHYSILYILFYWQLRILCHKNHLPWKENYGPEEHKTKINNRADPMD
jgi:hypothetical protein